MDCPGLLNLFFSLLLFLPCVLHEKGSDFELSSDIEQLVLVLLLVPLQIRDLNGASAKERADEAATEPFGKLGQVARVVLQVDDRALDDELPTGLFETARIEPGLHEGLEVGLNHASIHVHHLGDQVREDVLSAHLFALAVLHLYGTTREQVLHLLEVGLLLLLLF